MIEIINCAINAILKISHLTAVMKCIVYSNFITLSICLCVIIMQQ